VICPECGATEETGLIRDEVDIAINIRALKEKP